MQLVSNENYPASRASDNQGPVETMVSVPDVTAMGLLVYQMTQMRQRADQLIQQERDRVQALEATAAAVSKAAQDAAAVVAVGDDDMEEGADEQEMAESETDDDENESDSD
jgi:type II secretory pathway component PulM